MPTTVSMPQLGETVTEGTILRWLKQVGDAVATDEMLVEISTDKVDTEVPSPVTGVLQEILAAEGETIQVGAPMAVIAEEGEAAAPALAPAAAPEPAPEPPRAPEAAASSGRASHPTAYINSWIISPAWGPTTVAPTMGPPAWFTTLTNPWFCPIICARPTPTKEWLVVSTSIPAATACASVKPTAATSG